MKKEKAINDIHLIIKMFCIMIAVMSLIYVVLFFAWLFDLEDHIKYKHSVKTKEDVFQMMEEEQDEYLILIHNMETIIQEEGENEISCNRTEYQDRGFDSILFKKYPIDLVVVSKNEENIIRVDVQFVFPPRPYEYWGIYYASTDVPFGWGGKGELEEENGNYIENGSYYTYETEKITDNWYYYQCYTR